MPELPTPRTPTIIWRMNTFPPEGYVQIESAVAGITVYAPAPETEDPDELVTFKCPQCGKDRAFSAADGGLTCSACGYHEVPEAQLVGRGAEQFEFTAETVDRAAHGWGIERKAILCQECSAETTLSAEMLTDTCNFCGSVRVIQKTASQDDLRPRFLIPPKLTGDDIRRRTEDWLGSHWMTPRNLSEHSAVRDYAPMYLPYWTFDADTTADWRAQVGHTRTRTRNGKTETYTVWKWENGSAQLNIDDLLVPGTRHVSEVLLERIADFDMGGLLTYEPGYLAGIQAQAYERQLDAAWKMGREKMREATKKACKNQASSNKIRNFSMNLTYSNESWRYVLLPVYVSTYQYDSNTYQLIANAQTGTVSGQRPVVWWKVYLAVFGIMSPLLALVFYTLIQGTGFYEDFGQFMVIIGLVLAFPLGSLALYVLRTADALDDV